MSGSIDGKVVTSVSSGIGEATAQALSDAGAKVALVARRKDRIDALAERIRSGGGTTVAIAADITEEATANDALRRANEELGGLDFRWAVYNMTKWGVVGFSKGLRQVVLHANVRVTVIEPGFVETELQGHNEHPPVLGEIEKMRDRIEPLQSADIANAVLYAVGQPST